MRPLWALTVLLALPVAGDAAEIEAVGTLGNSGEAGATLVRVGPWPLAQTASGAALDRDCTLWLSGGSAINRVSLAGHLIERFALEPRNSLVQSKTFATLKDTLYFLGKLQTGKLALFELPMQSGARAKALPVSVPEHKRPHLPPCVAPQPLNDQLVMLAEPKEFQDARIAVYFSEPGAAALRTAFELTG
ncbi:MAG: hypothetical protein FJ272_13005, partial [Planctomycetes bacterium]|nr:hypothetical protein [Planctomycetota bacterium]